MRKLVITLILILLGSTAFAAKIPDNVKDFVKKDFPQAYIRFDGLITLPDGTVYLPLYPALVKKNEVLAIKTSYPANTPFSKKPDAVIFNTDFVLLKVLTDKEGHRTVLRLDSTPTEFRTGLLPQDLLVPKGLIIPENMKGIIGNLKIATAEDAGVKVKTEATDLSAELTKVVGNKVSSIPQLKGKNIYVSTCYSKNIQVITGENRKPDYALALKSVPIDIKVFDDKFILATAYDRKIVEIISLAEDRIIKKIDLPSQPEQILIDEVHKKAYISSPEDASIYLIDLNTMILKQKIQINGMCEHLFLTDDGSKLLYVDKKTNLVWAVELDNKYLIKEIGRFPNTSKVVLQNGKIYITSRTKNHLAIIDYQTLGLIGEIEIVKKPIDMLPYKNNLFILGAQDTVVQVLNTDTDIMTHSIFLNTEGFSTKIYQLKGSNLAIVTDTKAAKYSVIDLTKKEVIKTNPIDVPISTIQVANKIKKIDK